MVICRDTPNKILFIIFFLYCGSYANAEVYKWVDENGKIVYGDKPTSSDADKIKIKKSPVQDPVVQQRNEKQNKLLDVIQDDREQRDALRKEEEQKNDEHKKKCADARKELKRTKEASYLYEKTDDPKTQEYGRTKNVKLKK